VRFLADMGISGPSSNGCVPRATTPCTFATRAATVPRTPTSSRRAIAEQQIVLTFDLAFGEIAALSQGQKASVVRLRLQNARTSHVIDRLVAVLADCGPALDHGAVVIVEESRHRIRALPIGG
jgi:uncharacterized protein DUF5615